MRGRYALCLGVRDFLVHAAAPQGTLNCRALSSNKAGVEGKPDRGIPLSWITPTASEATQGSAASDWIWGSVVSDDAYKGSDVERCQPGLNDVEAYHWGTA